MAAYGLCGPALAKQINYERRQTHTYYNKQPLGPRGSLLPCVLKCQAVGVPPTAPAWSVRNNRYSKTDPEALMHLNLYGSPVADASTLRTHGWEGLWLAEALPRAPSIVPDWMAERPLIGWGLVLNNKRVTNYQRVRTNQAMDTQLEYPCLGTSPAIPWVGGKPVT